MNKNKEFHYEILYTKAAGKFFNSHEIIREQCENAMKELISGDYPEIVDVKRIKGKHNYYYRIRLGGYRVIYTIINGKIVVVSTILEGPRGDVYKKIDGLN